MHALIFFLLLPPLIIIIVGGSILSKTVLYIRHLIHSDGYYCPGFITSYEICFLAYVTIR